MHNRALREPCVSSPINIVTFALYICQNRVKAACRQLGQMESMMKMNEHKGELRVCGPWSRNLLVTQIYRATHFAGVAVSLPENHVQAITMLMLKRSTFPSSAVPYLKCREHAVDLTVKRRVNATVDFMSPRLRTKFTSKVTMLINVVDKRRKEVGRPFTFVPACA